MIFQGLFDFFEGATPWTALCVLGCLTGVFLMIGFKYMSNQGAIRTVKGKIKAHFLEIWIFKDDPWVCARALRAVLFLQPRHMSLILPPFLILAIPVVILIWFADAYLGYRPLLPGEQAIVSLITCDRPLPDRDKVVIRAGNNRSAISIDTDALVIPDDNEIAWRLTAKSEGTATLILNLATTRFTKKVVIGDRLARVLAKSSLGGSFWEKLIYPLDGSGSADWGGFLQIAYPKRGYALMGFQFHWMVWFFILASLAGLLCMYFLKVRL